MEVFRITHYLYTDLLASGKSARWNNRGKFIIYTTGSRALACLENLVHRNGEGLNSLFKILTIEIPNSVKIKSLCTDELYTDWQVFTNSYFTRQIGDEFLSQNKYPILKVPSVIIPEESNYLINPNNIDFRKIKTKSIEDFLFDNRLK
ncbi:MAG: RES family NAD+ phosphorylase [Melioribacteraceae bacterium]|nr:RES family NAD+ phosphorylase [Melioribacteraceae bacterium]